MDNVNEYFLSNVWPVLLSVTTIVALPLSAVIDDGVNNLWLLFVDCVNTIFDEVADILYVLPVVPKLYCSAPLKNLTSNAPSSKSLVTTDSDVAEYTWA